MHTFLTNTTATALTFGAITLIASILLLNRAFQSTMDGIEWEEQIHRVQTGDTLWAISKDYCPNSVDRREWISEIRALNHLNNNHIEPGQQIIVLAVKKGGKK